MSSRIPSCLQAGRCLLVPALFLVFMTSISHAQADPVGELSGSKFKNVTALADMPADQMGKVMNIMSASLNVNCQFCHAGTDFAKEDVAHKDIGRKMIEMTLELNKQHFEGRQEITCYTCHRGQSHPIATVPMEPASIATAVAQPAIKPTVGEIVSKYLDALGGREKLSQIKTRHTTARRVEPDGRTEPEELWQTAGGELRMVTTYGTVAVTETFDGQSASKKANEGAIQLKFDEALQIEREARLAFGLNIESAFEPLTFGRVEQIDDRRVFVLDATSSSKLRERLYFDEQTGFLIRRTASVPTLLGDFTYQVDYQDYRVFDGIQLPTKLLFRVPNISWTREVIAVEHNRSASK